MVTLLVAIVIGYILGSIASGVWLGKLIKNIDVREHGSGGTGATNVLRVLGWKLGATVMIIDVAKGLIACVIASQINLGDTMLTPVQLAIIAGVAAMLGHLFPVFAGFKGGKGIATGAGMLIYLAPLELVFAIVVFVLVIYITRYVSVGSVVAVTFLSLSILIEKYYFGYPRGDEMAFLAVVLILMVVYTHKANLKRVLNGTENKLGAKK